MHLVEVVYPYAVAKSKSSYPEYVVPGGREFT